MVDVYDMDDETLPDSQQEFVGSFEFQLHTVVTSLDQTVVADIKNAARGHNGKIKITGEEKNSESGNQSAIFNIDGLSQKSSANLFLIVWKWLSPGKYRPIFKSECKL